MMMMIRERETTTDVFCLYLSPLGSIHGIKRKKRERVKSLSSSILQESERYETP